MNLLLHIQIIDSGTGAALDNVTFDMDTICADAVSTLFISCEEWVELCFRGVIITRLHRMLLSAI